jgi:hypothetical protein
MDEYLLASMGRLTYVAAILKANNASCMANHAGMKKRLILKRARSSAG